MRPIKNHTKRKHLLANAKIISYLTSLGFHIVIIMLTFPHKRELSKKDKNRINVKIVNEQLKINPTIVEAPLPENDYPIDYAYLGRNEHKAEKIQKLASKRHKKQAEASRWEHQENKRIKTHEKTASDRKTQAPEIEKIEDYAKLLPKINDIPSAPAGAFRDFLQEKDIPEANFLDINTTRYSLIAYFTKIRKQVDMAYSSPLSKLKQSPRIKQILSRQQSLQLSGSSIAEITVDRSGFAQKIAIKSSSGDRELDEAWLHTLQLASPFPSLPAHIKDRNLTFRYTLHYKIVMNGTSPQKQLYF